MINKKRRVQIALKIGKTFLFLILLIPILFTLSYLFIPKNNMSEFGMDNVKANGILGERQDSIDVLVLGDSESLSAISPMEMWQQEGFTYYVCGTSGQYLYTSENFLKQAFQKQSPKVVILETNAIYRGIPINNIVMNQLKTLFPVFNYHNRWKSLRSNELFTSIEYTWVDDYKGFVYNTVSSPATNTDYMTPSNNIAKIPIINQLYVKSMADFCKDNGAQLILVSTPSTLNWNYERHNGIQQLANQLQLTYIDLNLASSNVNIDWSTDTLDKGDHLNYKGAVKVSTWLSHYLKENYALTNRKEDSYYSKWNEAYQRYKKAVSN